jgi:hypothetical protein
VPFFLLLLTVRPVLCTQVPELLLQLWPQLIFILLCICKAQLIIIFHGCNPG